jgi:hypothetical protein
MSDSRGDDADIHPYPGQDRPAGPGAEDGGVRGQPGDDPGAALPSEMQGHEER